MASKDKELTPEQIRILRRNHLDPALWEVLQDYRQSMLVRALPDPPPAFEGGGM